MSQLRWSSGACSDVGHFRDRNEDSLLDRSDIGVWAVADGMGGHDYGDYASRLTIEALPATAPPNTLSERVREISDSVSTANDELVNYAPEGGMCGTTLVAVSVVNGFMSCMWVGDSRAYLWRDGELEQITHDHTELQELLDAGSSGVDEMWMANRGNVLTRAIGGGPAIEIDLTEIELQDEDIVLLCSDGLYGEVDEADMIRVFQSMASPAHMARRLVDRALEGECLDNVSVVVVHFERWD